MIQYHWQNQTFEKKQSAFGRGIVGGLLAGPIGACIGAFTAGKKQKKSSHLYLIISYISLSGRKDYIKFEDTRMYKGKKLVNKLKKLCGIKADKKIKL